MKNYFILLGVLILFSTSLNSQTTAFYLSTGYSIPTTTSVIGNLYTGNTVEVNSATYAKGFIIQGGYQLIVNNNFVFDLNFNYLFGLKNKVYQTNYNGVQGTFSNSNFSMAPSVCLKFNVGIFSPYTKFGFSVNFISMAQKWETDNNWATTYKREYSYKGDFSLGIIGGIGVDFQFDNTFILYIETQMNSMTYYPDEVEVTEFYSDGTKSKETYQFVNKVDENNSEENVALAYGFPYSSISFIGGVKIVL